MGRTLRMRALFGGAGPTDMADTLSSLQTCLREATDFSVPWRQFHDAVAMVPAFSTESIPARNARIEAALSALGDKLLGKGHSVSEPMFLHLQDHRFWHGTCRLGSRTAIFFYFEQADMGLAGVFRALTDTVLGLARFSLIELPRGTGFSRGRGIA
jgi:hypothetical protein